MEAFRDAVWSAVSPGAEPERFAARRAFLMHHVRPGDRVLDLGCGEGAFALVLAAAGARTTAADVSPAALERARRRPGMPEAVLLAEDAELPFAEAAFDVVWAGEVLEHTVDTALLLAQVRRVLRFGGTLLVTTPANGGVRGAVLALRPRAFDAHFDPRADHLRFYTARTLRTVLRDAGFPDTAVHGAGGVPGWRSALHAVAR